MNRLNLNTRLLIVAAAVIAVCLINLTPARAHTNERVARAFDPSAKLNKVAVDYNVVENGRRGMRIKVDFEVTGLKGVDSSLIVRVQDEDEEYVKSTSSFSDADGNLELKFSMTPGYDTAVYDDASLFLPYAELKLAKGVWNMKLDIDVGYEDGDLIQHLTYKNFIFTSPNSAADGGPDAGGEVKKVWVEQNAVDRGRRGIKVHVSFEVTGLKNVSSMLVVRFRRGEKYLASSSSMANDDGELEASYDLLPKYDPAVYDDVTMFVPYTEFDLRKGSWMLEADVDIKKADGDLIEHLTFYEFELTK